VADSFNPSGVGAPGGAYSQAAWAAEGRLLFISGQVATDVTGRVVGVGDARAQTRQTLQNIGTILASVGADFDSIVSVGVFVTDLADVPAIHEVRREFFRAPYPASTLVQVAALNGRDLLVEINAVAVVPPHPQPDAIA
jgi:reactive intermediate/imine deaminase